MVAGLSLLSPVLLSLVTQALSAASTTTRGCRILPTDIPDKTISMTKILCPTKAPSTEEAAWGSMFKVTDALSAVDKFCDFDVPIRLFISEGQKSFFIRAVQNITEEKDKNVKKPVNLFLTAFSQEKCQVIFDSRLCREAYYTILSGHPSCPNRDGWTMGGVGFSECAQFQLTGGTSYFYAITDLGDNHDWDMDHYCNAKLNAKCEL